MPSSSWHITFGDYDLSVDRRALMLSLTETRTGTVWGTDISLGWIELQNRETGDVSRHPFGSLRQLSVSEKAGPQGKRILWGLDADGVPVDIYLICAQREIQLVAEASRDSKTHRVHGFGLVPGLCSIPPGDGNFRIRPIAGGTYLRPYLSPERMASVKQLGTIETIWGYSTLPVSGAIRQLADGRTSALGLITDSAYAGFADTGASFDPQYERDPERRRLDLRILIFPDGDAISVARAYREKQIASNNHVTLRRKMRENPTLETLLGQAVLFPRGTDTTARTLATRLEDEYQVRSIISGTPEAPAISRLSTTPLEEIPDRNQSRWDDMENRLQLAKGFQESGALTFANSPMDWAAIAADLWAAETGDEYELPPRMKPLVPLQAAIYHDSVLSTSGFYASDTPVVVLRALLNLALPTFYVNDKPISLEHLGPICAVLCALNPLTFATFLTQHRFLTPDYLVEEAIYSDKTRIVINQSATNPFESDDLTLPPLGFYVRHRQVEAHDACRVGDQTFPTRKYRLARAGDGKPLETSDNVLRQEWDVPQEPSETETGQNPLS